MVSSLWTVDDGSTYILMRKMYENIKDGMPKAKALRQSQLWLKDPANREEQRNMLKELEKIARRVMRSAGTSAETTMVENLEKAPIDRSLPYHWAAFICSGVYWE
jgi:CHAT domain-containing protein